MLSTSHKLELDLESKQALGDMESIQHKGIPDITTTNKLNKTFFCYVTHEQLLLINLNTFQINLV